MDFCSERTIQKNDGIRIVMGGGVQRIANTTEPMSRKSMSWQVMTLKKSATNRWWRNTMAEIFT